MTRLSVPFALLITVFAVWPCHGAQEPFSPEHRLTLYRAWYSPNRMLEILQFDARTAGHSHLTALAYAHRLGAGSGPMTWEIEGQVAKHSGRQSHLETNLLIAARWNRLPWDAYVNTSAALGWGLSYAHEIPDLEPRADRDEQSTHLLSYLLVELDFSAPTVPQWGLVLRLHHRSGVFGTFGGVRGGSNFLGAGLRYQF